MNEILVVAYFVTFIVCAVGSHVFFWRRDPRFKWRWYRRVTIFNFIVVGGMMLILLAQTSPPFLFSIIFVGALFFIGWVAAFQTRVCTSCGKVSQPQNLVTAPKFCTQCGAKLEPPSAQNTSETTGI